MLAGILAAFCLVRWPFRETVLVRDEGEYAYIEQHILRPSLFLLPVLEVLKRDYAVEGRAGFALWRLRDATR